MRLIKSLLPLFALVLLASCLSVAPGGKTAAGKTQPEAPRARLSPEDMKKVEQLYYQAVNAYSKDDPAGADRYLREIAKLDAAYAPAEELRRKLKFLEKEAEPRKDPAPAQPARPR